MYINYARLWKKLAEKELSKSDLMELTGLSSRVIAKLAKNETVTTDTVAKICSALHCDVGEIMECTEEKALSLYHYSRSFGTVAEENEAYRRITFRRNGLSFALYLTRQRATKATRIDCGADGTIYCTRYYIGGGHGAPRAEKSVLVKPTRARDEIVAVVIKGKPGTITGLDEGIWVSAKNGVLRSKGDIFVMSEAAFKLFDFEGEAQ